MEDINVNGSATLESNDSGFRSDSFPILTYANLSEDDRAYFRSLFEKFDKDHNGAIDVNELTEMLKQDQEVSRKIIKKLVKYSDKNQDGRIDFEEFTDMVLDKNFKQLFGGYVKSYVNLIVPRNRRRQKFKPVGRSAAGVSAGTSDEPDGAYEEGFSCWPPPVCMILVSIFEIICYIMNENIQGGDSTLRDDGIGPVAQILIYNPEKRQECWRFLTYMLVHIGWVHLTMNLITQIFLGLALELRNRWWRILTVYFAGVVAGSLVTSIMDPTVYLAGASGGVYAIITSHLSNIVINWNDMRFASVQLFIFILLISADVATAIHNRHYLGDQTPIGYAAHFGGALAGFLVGIWVLKNVEPTDKEKYLWWGAFVLYILLMGTGIVLNIVWKGHFLHTKY